MVCCYVNAAGVTGDRGWKLGVGEGRREDEDYRDAPPPHPLKAESQVRNEKEGLGPTTFAGPFPHN